MREPSVLELIHEWVQEQCCNFPIQINEDPNIMDLSFPLMGIIRIGGNKSVSIYVYPEHVELLRHIINDLNMTRLPQPGSSRVRLLLADPEFFEKIDKWISLNLV